MNKDDLPKQPEMSCFSCSDELRKIGPETHIWVEKKPDYPFAQIVIVIGKTAHCYKIIFFDKVIKHSVEDDHVLLSFFKENKEIAVVLRKNRTLYVDIPYWDDEYLADLYDSDNEEDPDADFKWLLDRLKCIDIEKEGF